MTSGDTQPTQPLPDWQPAAEPRRRRRIWPWLVALVVVVVLGIVAWFVAESIARDLVTTTIRDEVVAQLDLPADQQVDVEVPGTIIPQLIAGSLDEVTISSDDVPIGGFTGDVTVTAQDVPIRGGDMGGAAATVTLDEEQLRAIMATVDGFPADTLGLAEPDVTFSTELSLFGVGIPVGVSLTPQAVEGDLVLTPSAIELAGADVSADRLRDQFGVLADVVLKDWTVCLAEYLPAGVTVTGVQVDGEQLVADLDVDGGIVSDPELQAMGTCE
ncbi:DUF2993 domain-containing protein [Microbacterium sp. 2FI]|uniref:LmeA family phospholipid-binding protein n=1 Tax=Microbacterium sp. 2FI TaxID=2502193 RepID=UPI0010F977D8|nr:DUF2993 domain-containing protein [Microbacterium sp. 2FI]